MPFFSFLRRSIPDTHPLRLFYHRVMAVLAALFYRFPANHLRVIAVTGTHGKTTTTNLIAHILECAGEKVGLTSTIGFKVGKRSWPNLTKQTTLSPFALQRLLRRMVRAGCRYAVIETSSHAMTQSRLWGVNVDVAVLTNIAHDHIEYHGGMRQYIEAKGMLFRGLHALRRKPGFQKIIVLNRDIPEFDYFNRFVADRTLTYGFSKKANVMAQEVEHRLHVNSFLLKIPNDEVRIDFQLPGKFNVANGLAAATVALGCGVSLPSIQKALESARGLPGRLESIDMGQDFSVIVDYAHTAEALEELCKLLRELTKGRLILVFGATGGGRDKAKRPKMGAIADRYADAIILTDDDPYDEDEEEIIENIAAGIHRPAGENFWKIVNRREAIRFALSHARKDDTVALVGKGCEECMVLRGKKIPHDDRKVAREMLGSLERSV